MKKLPRISDAEWLVMKVLWSTPGMTADQVVEALQGKVPQIYLIGDAKEESHYILGSVSDGAEIARIL